MSKFITHLRVEEIVDGSDDGRGTWQLLFPLIYESDILNSEVVAVPEGFITDFASVPRIPVAFLLAGGYGRMAAVIHDYLYTTHQVSRETADSIFREALLAMGEPAWRVELMWMGVRVGGEGPWTADGQAQPPKVAAVISSAADQVAP